jgi:hypothetical protein
LGFFKYGGDGEDSKGIHHDQGRVQRAISVPFSTLLLSEVHSSSLVYRICRMSCKSQSHIFWICFPFFSDSSHTGVSSEAPTFSLQTQRAAFATASITAAARGFLKHILPKKHPHPQYQILNPG